MSRRSAQSLAGLVGAALVAGGSLAGPAAAQTSATPTVTATPGDNCPVVRLLVDPRNAASGRVIAPVNGPVYLRVQADRPDARYLLERVAPNGPILVRQGSGTATDFTIYPAENSAFQARGVNGSALCAPSATVQTYVRPRLTITARRNAPRDYTFTGRVLPGRGQTVTLYRCDTATSSTCVKTAQGQVRPDGSYRIDRRFFGSGRFGIYTAVSESPTNLGGASNVRPTVIH